MSLEEVKNKLKSISEQLLELKNKESELKRLEYLETKEYSKYLSKDLIELNLLGEIDFDVGKINDCCFELKTRILESEDFYNYLINNKLYALSNFELDGNDCYIDSCRNNFHIYLKYELAKEFIKKYNIRIYHYDIEREFKKIKKKQIFMRKFWR